MPGPRNWNICNCFKWGPRRSWCICRCIKIGSSDPANSSRRLPLRCFCVQHCTKHGSANFALDSLPNLCHSCFPPADRAPGHTTSSQVQACPSCNKSFSNLCLCRCCGSDFVKKFGKCLLGHAVILNLICHECSVSFLVARFHCLQLFLKMLPPLLILCPRLRAGAAGV